jgi:hypothetical protein
VSNSDARLNWNILEISGLFHHLHSPRSNLIIREIRPRMTRWVGHAVLRGNMRNSCKILGGKREGVRPLQAVTLSAIKIKRLLKICNIIYVPSHSVNLCGSGYEVVESSCQYCKEFADSTNCQEFTDQQNNCTLLENYTQWIELLVRVENCTSIQHKCLINSRFLLFNRQYLLSAVGLFKGLKPTSLLWILHLFCVQEVLGSILGLDSNCSEVLV